MTLREKIGDIAEAARQKRERDFHDAAAGLSATNRQLVAAHYGFAVLHMVMCEVAEALTAAGQPVELLRKGNEVSARGSNRFVLCRFFLDETTIAIEFLGDARPDWQKRWTPSAVDLVDLRAEAVGFGEEFARHLAGAT